MWKITSRFKVGRFMKIAKILSGLTVFAWFLINNLFDINYSIFSNRGIVMSQKGGRKGRQGI